MIKIQYINRKPHYDKAIISVEDHVSCRCQTASPSSSSSSSVPVTRSSNPNPPPPPPQQQPPSSSHPLPHPRPVQPPLPKTPSSKADLHRHDDLKHNQQHYHPEEREPVARQWQQGSYTQLVHWTQPRVQPAPVHVQSGGLGPVNSWPSEARAGHVIGSTTPVGHGSGYDGSKEEGSIRHPDDAQRQQQLLRHQQRLQYQQQHPYHLQPHYPQQHNHGGAEDQELRAQHRLNAPQSDSASPPGSPTQQPQVEQTPTLPLTTNQKDSTCQTEVTTHKQTEAAAVSQREGNWREESGSANTGDSANQGKEKDSKLTGGGGPLTEEERRQKLLEMVQRDPEKHQHPRHRQQTPKPTTFKTGISYLRKSV